MVVVKNRRVKITQKTCDFCGKSRPIFKNVAGEKQCKQCYNAENAKKFYESLNPGKTKRGARGKKAGKIKQMINETNLVNQIDELFSRYIRYKHESKTAGGWFGNCYTCDAMHATKYLQCGHFVPRANMRTRWMVENCKPQCYKCNVSLSGNLTEFAKRLEFDSPGIVEKLETLGREVHKYSMGDLQKIKQELLEAVQDQLTN